MANIEENQDITDNEDVINDNETVSADNIADNSEDIPAGDNNVEINGEDDSQESTLVSINSLSYDYIISVIEAVLFSVGESVGVQELAVALNVPVKELEPVVDQYILEYNSCKRGIKIVKLEDSYQMCTRNEYYGELSRVVNMPKKHTLTDVLLETLSIIAYKQPITRPEIEAIRGVSCSHAINRLMEYNLVTEVGRLDAPGKPILFGTTEDFLRSFGVQSIDELPTISEDMVEQYKEEAELELASESFDADNQEDSDGQITLGI